MRLFLALVAGTQPRLAVSGAMLAVTLMTLRGYGPALLHAIVILVAWAALAIGAVFVLAMAALFAGVEQPTPAPKETPDA